MNAEYLAAMKADAIPEGWSGLWFVKKATLSESKSAKRFGEMVACPPGIYTHLFRVTNSTIHLNPPGDVVMEDSPFELETHLEFVKQAFGNVLVTGLGLGCVVRGLLENDNVEHVTCIENSKDVLKLVAPYMPADRLTIIEADALQWTASNRQKFDCAWHDLWTDQDEGEPHLDVWHTRLLINCHRTIRHQGAWALDERLKSKLVGMGFPWIG